MFDLAIAMGILAASGEISQDKLNGLFFLGELSLDGSLRSVNGILPLASSLNPKECRHLLFPPNAVEAALANNVSVFGVDSLTDLVLFCKGEKELVPVDVKRTDQLALGKKSNYSEDFADVRGQESAKRALEIAAAGNHNVLLYGPPGSGKTMLARRLSTILPSMSLEESLSRQNLQRSRAITQRFSLIMERPFRSPHHSATAAGIVGGGRIPGLGSKPCS